MSEQTDTGAGLKDGRSNWRADDDIEGRLEAHFEQYGVSKNEIWRLYPVQIRHMYEESHLVPWHL